MCASDFEGALARLQPPQPDPHTRSTFVVPLFICAASTLAVRIACLLLEAWVPPTAPFAVQLLVEVATSIFLIDLISGIFHASLDFADPGLRLREVIPSSKAEVHQVRRGSMAFLRSNAWNQAVWNFQAHHFAPYPEHDDQWLETACLATPLLLLTFLQSALGFLAPLPTRIWCGTLALGHGVQASHFLAHRRVHEGEHSLPVCGTFPARARPSACRLEALTLGWSMF